MSRPVTQLAILVDLMSGGKHSRTTVRRAGASLATADRWLKGLLLVPGVRSVREGKVSWFVWCAPARGLPVFRRVYALLEKIAAENSCGSCDLEEKDGSVDHARGCRLVEALDLAGELLRRKGAFE